MKQAISVFTCTLLLFGQVQADIELPDLGSPSDIIYLNWMSQRLEEHISET